MNSCFNLLFLFGCLPTYILGSHFRGGTISWRYIGPGNQVEFKFKLGWVLNTVDSTSNWMAISSSMTSIAINTVAYNRTEINTAEQWEQGEKTFIFNFPTEGQYSVHYSSCCCISLSFGSGGNWKLETIVDLHTRSDTLKPNNSPLTTSRAMYRVEFGCVVSIEIPMIDIDGDNVRCRWATVAEADSISQLLPNARLNETACTLDFVADAANNYVSNGWFAVALMIEDFPKETISINGKVFTPSTPISKVPLQFLIKTEPSPGTTQNCDAKPVFVEPTPDAGTIYILKASVSFTERFYVQSNVSLKSVDISGPSGMITMGITPDDQGRPNVWFVEITWTPTHTDQGTHIICGNAEDSLLKLSDTRCLTIMAWDVDPCAINPCQNLGTCDRSGYTADYTCSCIPGFTGRNCETDVDECMSSPCKNGGNCLDFINEYRCHCLVGFTGKNCETDIYECVSNPCQHNSTCIDLVNGFTCNCDNGYTGTYCEIDIDECQSNPCFNNATCVDGIAMWSCSCQDGFTGLYCQTDVDECSSNPCQHNATCTDLVNGYACQCTNDSIGNNCQQYLDHCSPNPCLHGGSCNNHYGGYTCDCADMWYGDICEYREINKTEVCTDLEYTECSCFTSRLLTSKPQSYKILSGSIGFITGLLGAILAYAVWIHISTPHVKRTKIWPHVTSSRVTTLSDMESEEMKHDDAIIMKSEEIKHDDASSTKDESSVKSAGPIHCDCFVDHTGYDHFQRLDEKSNRFKFTSCRHQTKVPNGNISLKGKISM